ncbi:hypothetical protein NOS3756_44610 [Nostoc sp. NIES-3756]|uniref:hypothetical protein n=1 Tax=Nostoc sp. NIES-3756 TaxID=1751286 RepID=UPI00071EF1B4|nr:hypothetical protein [Nostoc sp. NIES-3756]BAT55474.1 hypothetical protein NOS3756_44610 [Nostoc sp. NIES-3756]
MRSLTYAAIAVILGAGFSGIISIKSSAINQPNDLIAQQSPTPTPTPTTPTPTPSPTSLSTDSF